MRSSQEQLSHRAAIPVFGDAADLHLLAQHHAVKMIPCCFGRCRVSSGSRQLRHVDAGQADLFAGAHKAGANISAALDYDVRIDTRMRCHQQQGERQLAENSPALHALTLADTTRPTKPLEESKFALEIALNRLI